MKKIGIASAVVVIIGAGYVLFNSGYVNKGNTSKDSPSVTNQDNMDQARLEDITDDVNDEVTAKLVYANGQYSGTRMYDLPSGDQSEVTINLVFENDTVSAASMTFATKNNTSRNWIRKFEAAYQSEVVEKNIDDVSLSRVAGASLTTDTFNDIWQQATAEARI